MNLINIDDNVRVYRHCTDSVMRHFRAVAAAEAELTPNCLYQRTLCAGPAVSSSVADAAVSSLSWASGVDDVDKASCWRVVTAFSGWGFAVCEKKLKARSIE